jgi:hypothetical protein
MLAKISILEKHKIPDIVVPISLQDTNTNQNYFTLKIESMIMQVCVTFELVEILEISIELDE